MLPFGNQATLPCFIYRVFCLDYPCCVMYQDFEL